MTSKKKYPSRYSNGKEIAAAQYLAEMMCERMAQKNRKELPQRFWNQPEWKKSYRSQLLAAQGLLKIYDESVVIRAVKNLKGIYSLRAPSLDDAIKEEKKKAEANKDKKANVKRVDTKAKPRQHRTRKTQLGKLKELDL
jgi:hypothetical protein